MKINISKILFLLYFLVYAISPLSHTLTPQNSYQLHSSNELNASTNNLRIFMWEIIFSKLTGSDESRNDHDSSENRVLLRKARAILPENISGKSISQERASLVESLAIPRAQTSSLYLMIDEVRQPAGAINSLYSGNSPPFSNPQSRILVNNPSLFLQDGNMRPCLLNPAANLFCC